MNADRSYDISYGKHTTGLVAVRTRTGCGEVSLNSNSLHLTENSVAVIEQHRLIRYRCAADAWAFWWFEFQANDALPITLNKPYTVQPDEREEKDFDEAFSRLQHPASQQRSIASAAFVLMFHRWIAAARAQETTSPHRLLIDEIINRIHADLSREWKVSQLAEIAGIGETVFRREFVRATGLTPGRFVHQARLRAAAQMIDQGIYTLAAIADQLRFSSPFHLSTAFKQFFGVRPSRLVAGDSMPSAHRPHRSP